MVVNGIHHVTAIAGRAARNLDFYTRTLGLRLVKKTVNFDDPGTYHLYYGDETGQPGTILTFFPWDHAAPGRLGVGETQEIVFCVPEGAIGFWSHRLIEKGVPHDSLVKRFGETVLAFRDPDGLRLAFVARAGDDLLPGRATPDIPAEHAIRGFHSISLLLEEAEATAAILTGILGFREMGREESLIRFVCDATFGRIIDLRAVGGFLKPRVGAGSVHHVAFRAADDAQQAEMVRKLAENHGIAATEQKDRNYFRSVYFREPGHVLFEIATDVPGFAIDEGLEDLGRGLRLPPFLESRREEIEGRLPDLG